MANFDKFPLDGWGVIVLMRTPIPSIIDGILGIESAYAKMYERNQKENDMHEYHKIPTVFKRDPDDVANLIGAYI